MAPVARLLESAAARIAQRELPETSCWVIGPEAHPDPDVLARAAASDGARFLVLGWIGVHPDARSPILRGLWTQEEHARASRRPTLVLRMAPLLSPTSPLWQLLRRRPDLPRGGRTLLQPVGEDDVVETLVRALSGKAAWDGWYELVGPETVSLAEWSERATRARVASAGDAGAAAWEPPIDVLNEQRLAEPFAWAHHFGIEPRSPLAALGLAA